MKLLLFLGMAMMAIEQVNADKFDCRCEVNGGISNSLIDVDTLAVLPMHGRAAIPTFKGNNWARELLWGSVGTDEYIETVVLTDTTGGSATGSSCPYIAEMNLLRFEDGSTKISELKVDMTADNVQLRISPDESSPVSVKEQAGAETAITLTPGTPYSIAGLFDLTVEDGAGGKRYTWTLTQSGANTFCETVITFFVGKQVNDFRARLITIAFPGVESAIMGGNCGQCDGPYYDAHIEYDGLGANAPEHNAAVNDRQTSDIDTINEAPLQTSRLSIFTFVSFVSAFVFLFLFFGVCFIRGCYKDVSQPYLFQYTDLTMAP